MVRDERNPRRYLTLDFWASQAAYDSFKKAHAADYQVLDAECKNFTEHETEIGGFASVPS